MHYRTAAFFLGLIDICGNRNVGNWCCYCSKWRLLMNVVSGQFSRNNFHFFCHILSCIAETSKHLAKRNIGQFNHTLWPSFAQQNVLDKLNIFLRYHQIKMQKRWNSAFHHWRILIWRYLKNLFSLSKIFLWSKLGQSIQMNCPILFLIRCLLVLAVQYKMLRQWWTRSGRMLISCPFWF